MLGLVVNPVAGVGGPAGLAGSDGVDVQGRAAALGAVSHGTERAATALGVVARRSPHAVVLTAAGSMGETAVQSAGLVARVVATPAMPSTAADTVAATKALARAGATLILFAGGDGTARDVASALSSLGEAHGVGSAAAGPAPVAALGIPTGVKMYSAVFAVSPRVAGATAADWLDGAVPVRDGEVLDVDEEQMRQARVHPRLYGMMPVASRAGRTQARKAPSPAGEHAAVVRAARAAVSAMRPGVRYLLGPGSTMAELARQLGVPKTPLGVDVVLDGRLLRAAASEADLLEEAGRGPAQAVVTVIGGQGFVLGRGNQQLSAAVLARMGSDPLMIVAPEQKLVDLHGRPLFVDTGDPAVDARLAGFVRVVTGSGTVSLYRLVAPDSDLSTTIEGVCHAA